MVKKSAYLLIVLFICLNCVKVSAQTAYFIDGYHGGIWGHYPDWNTRFMTEMLKKNPGWKINIELEPETWARAKVIDPSAYADFKALFADQSLKGRIEYVNPAYAQSYMYNISGESIIRQLSYGMKMIKSHFPEVVFSTYSSEEPCFTSALPQILTSFGFKYASLKNPNTCFGGYTRPHSGELVNWIGPDGTPIITSPRYDVEKLAAKSTWQTIAWNNSAEYVNEVLANGIAHPIGMTLQDAGWKGGPFIGDGLHGSIKSVYTTWRNYFADIAAGDARQNWKVTQEDILVSLVWGSQITQQIAQKVRISENKLVAAEKLRAMAKIYVNAVWPQVALDSAWRTLLLSQHHDCWIVPYNGRRGNTWADKVTTWTGNTNRLADSLTTAALMALNQPLVNGNFITVYNTTAVNRDEVISVKLAGTRNLTHMSLVDANGQTVSIQITDNSIIFKARIPSIGYAVYQLLDKGSLTAKGAGVNKLANGNYQVETDLYKLIIDPWHGGAIKSIIAKKLNNKEFVDQSNARSFNELRGNFYNHGGFKSSVDSAAKVEIIENGPLRIKVLVTGHIAGNNYTQVISLAQGQPRIDIKLNIDWKGNTAIGQDIKPIYKLDLPAKPFYDDHYKLLALFPLNLKKQKVYKNAPFDVTESELKDTFFNRWDSIKNNVILNWVDVTDNNDQYGMALFTDHTTSYTHGEEFPLGLNVQYSGIGLWGRNYGINGPTQISYALIPHAGRWDKAGIWTEGTKWSEPLITVVAHKHPLKMSRSLVKVPAGYEVSAINFNGNDMLVRIFNTGTSGQEKLIFGCRATKAILTELNGKEGEELPLSLQPHQISTTIAVPKFGIRTIKLVNAVSF
ncbi:glycoside hydrolase family 38 C-terminal domain-containing protein [Mucilaginibacter sp. UR6-11]|uniref:glycoside hydrolase family 38 C-terminal domain-containing protein n=1 Tax=Mucilaginibacter sp. UR6-11 TaxID=1435644 RepID=UPI001E411FAA|nr:glycoside hydrolase family 38 C-terminal domain-containing protein [Mucilaginibacter sp. UR6-11]MCC8425808.1 glycosyl hydrolase [Mucilaginibacter sp. UR6-11]